MRLFFKYLYKGIKKVVSVWKVFFSNWITWILFYINNVQYKSFKTQGIPLVNMSIGSKFVIGDDFKLNNNFEANPIGRVNRCSFAIYKNAKLEIGDNVGMSSTAIVCYSNVIIEDNVKIGGNVVIYDTDFHSLNYKERLDSALDKANTKKVPIRICKNAFIGAHSTILKGVSIGENVIVAACSVVTKDIPKNQIWGGNPARFIREINNF